MKTKRQKFEQAKQVGNTISVFTGLVIGSLVGAGTMLLMAPRPGKKTRAQLQGRALKFRKQTATTMKGTLTQVKSKANQLKANMQTKAQDLGHQGQGLLAKQLKHVSHAVQAGRKAILAS